MISRHRNVSYLGGWFHADSAALVECWAHLRLSSVQRRFRNAAIIRQHALIPAPNACPACWLKSVLVPGLGTAARDNLCCAAASTAQSRYTAEAAAAATGDDDDENSSSIRHTVTQTLSLNRSTSLGCFLPFNIRSPALPRLQLSDRPILCSTAYAEPEALGLRFYLVRRGFRPVISFAWQEYWNEIRGR